MTRTIAARLLAASLVLAGCGNDDEPDAGSADTPSSSETSESTGSETGSPSETDTETQSPTEPEPTPTAPTSTGEITPDRAAFLADANRICTRATRELDRASAGVDPNDPQAFRAFVTNVLVPNVRGQLEEIRALGVPAGDEAKLSRLFDQAEKALAQMEENPDIVVQGDPFGEVSDGLDGYGLTACSPS